MTMRADLAALAPAQRAEVIYAEARSELSNRLWRAALGDADQQNDAASRTGRRGVSSDALLWLLDEAGLSPTDTVAAYRARMTREDGFFVASDDGQRATMDRRGAAEQHSPANGFNAPPAVTRMSPLGANAQYAAYFAQAQARSGIPAGVVAAIVDAEAGKGPDGRWNPHSRNPRSSAAGLGQFLAGTWQRLAATPGTWLNAVAAERGWLERDGRVAPAARSALLAMRYDPEASIQSIGDLARENLAQLRLSGVQVEGDAERLARAAYLGHHLGLSDAKKFLSGGIGADRAKLLLTAQIGKQAAEQRIAGAGDAVQAHRQWLLGFIDRRISNNRDNYWNIQERLSGQKIMS